MGDIMVFDEPAELSAGDNTSITKGLQFIPYPNVPPSPPPHEAARSHGIRWADIDFDSIPNPFVEFPALGPLRGRITGYDCNEDIAHCGHDVHVWSARISAQDSQTARSSISGNRMPLKPTRSTSWLNVRIGQDRPKSKRYLASGRDEYSRKHGQHENSESSTDHKSRYAVDYDRPRLSSKLPSVALKEVSWTDDSEDDAFSPPDVKKTKETTHKRKHRTRYHPYQVERASSSQETSSLMLQSITSTQDHRRSSEPSSTAPSSPSSCEDGSDATDRRHSTSSCVSTPDGRLVNGPFILKHVSPDWDGISEHGRPRYTSYIPPDWFAFPRPARANASSPPPPNALGKTCTCCTCPVHGREE